MASLQCEYSARAPDGHRLRLRMTVTGRHGLQPAELLYPSGSRRLYHHGSHEILNFPIFANRTIGAIFIEDADKRDITEMLSEGNKRALVR